MKVWITKYALTEGVYSSEAAACSSPHMIVIKGDSINKSDQYFHRGEWFESLSGAFYAVDAMRQRKIQSLRKQIARLEELSFVPADALTRPIKRASP